MSRLSRNGVMCNGSALRRGYLSCLFGFLAFHHTGLTPAQQPLALTDPSAGSRHNKHYEHGLIYYRSWEHKLAVKEFEPALQENPDKPWVSYYLARAYFGNNNRDAA